MKRKDKESIFIIVPEEQQSDIIFEDFDLNKVKCKLEKLKKDLENNKYLQDSDEVIKVLELEIKIFESKDYEHIINFEKDLYQHFKDFYFIRIIKCMKGGSKDKKFVWDNRREKMPSLFSNKMTKPFSDRLYFSFTEFHKNLLSNNISDAQIYFRMFNHEINEVIINKNLIKMNLDPINDSIPLRKTLSNLEDKLDDM